MGPHVLGRVSVFTRSLLWLPPKQYPPCTHKAALVVSGPHSPQLCGVRAGPEGAVTVSWREGLEECIGIRYTDRDRKG